MKNSENRENHEIQRQSKAACRAVLLFSLGFWVEAELFEDLLLVRNGSEDVLGRGSTRPVVKILKIPDLDPGRGRGRG